jgi:hypothetical protein
VSKLQREETMMRFSKIASVSAFALLTAAALPAAADPPDSAIINLINYLSTPLSVPITFPQLDAQDLFSQDDPAAVAAVEQVFSAYVFYNDSHNGPGLASLYLRDGVDDHGYNNGSGEILPNFGLGGKGCVLRGTQQIATYISHVYGDGPILSYPDHGHHVVTSKLVKVVGDDAMLQAVWFGVSETTSTPTFSVGGEYLTTYKYTKDGWKIRTNHVIADQPIATTICDLNGPIPRTVP